MSFFDSQNPGIGGIDELTPSEEVFVMNLSGLSYTTGDILYYDGLNLNRLPIGSNGNYLTISSGLPAWGVLSLSDYVPYTGATADVNIGTHTYIGHTIKGDASDGIYIKANNDTNIGLLGAGNTANVTWYGNHNFDLATQDTIAGFTGADKTLGSLSTATYPSLTELSYVKGVTSAIQTQLDAKLGITTGAVSTSYTNVGGSGNRKALITVTTTITSLNGTPDYLVNGNTADNFFYWAGQTASGKYLRFDFGSGNKFVINEAKWYQDLSTSQGVWQWQGSNDASSWTNIGSTFTLGGVATQTQTELSANTTAYRYYQLLGVSGSLSGAPYDQEIEFKISTAITGTTADVTGRLYLQSNGNPLEVGGMAVFNAGIIYNSRPLISSQWQTSGSSIYYPVTGDSGDVGFGRVPTSGYRVDIEKIGRVVSSTSNQPAQFYWRNSSGNSAEFRIDSAVAPTLGIASAFHLLLSNANTGFIIDDGTTERYRFQRDGLFGIGSGANTVTKLHVIGTDTTNGQWRFGYDNSNYFKGVISSTGGVTFDAFGSGASFTFSDPVTIATSATTPLVIGGSGTTQSLTYKTTTGIGTTGADHIFLVGNNGATEAMRILNSGDVGIGTNSPSAKLHVNGTFIAGGNSTFNSTNMYMQSVSIITDTSTGLKIGTATNEKIGFFNSTPVVQQTGNIATALSNLGLVASPTYTMTNVLTDSGITPIADGTYAISNTLGGSVTIASGVITAWTPAP